MWLPVASLLNAPIDHGGTHDVCQAGCVAAIARQNLRALVFRIYAVTRLWVFGLQVQGCCRVPS